MQRTTTSLEAASSATAMVAASARITAVAYPVASFSVKLRMISDSSVIWVFVRIRVPYLVLIIVRHLIFRVPKKGP